MFTILFTLKQICQGIFELCRTYSALDLDPDPQHLGFLDPDPQNTVKKNLLLSNPISELL